LELENVRNAERGAWLCMAHIFTLLQERGGSSLPAIKKYVAEHHPNLPGPWEKTLSYQIRKMAASGKLVKVILRNFCDRCYMG